jgi:hypothetical protein
MNKKIYAKLVQHVYRVGLTGLCVATAATLIAQDITTGLKLHYTFETVLGNSVTDASGNNNTGTLQGATGLVTGYDGSGAQCILKADYISAPANINQGLTSFTFATWVKFSSMKNATRFFDWGNGVDATNNFLSFIPSFGSDDGFMVLRYRPVSGTAYNVTSTSKCPVGSWAHVAITFNWNPSTNTAVATIYLNGAAVGTTSGLPFNPHTSLGTTTDNYFGYSRWTQDLNGFNGIFDDIRLYNRALSAIDIAELTGLEALNKQFDLLTIDNLSAVTTNIDLPVTGPNYPSVAISWSSSNTDIISNTGILNAPSYFNSPVTLTATLTLGQSTKTKTFAANVLAKEGTKFNNDLLVRYDFSNVNNRIVKDVAEKQFSGTLESNATLRTIGTEQTGIYNVLDLGNATGYFDLGTEVGKVICLLNDYTLSTYFRIENDYTALSSFGNFIWNFSNSNNAASAQNGYIIGSLKDQSVSITPGYYTTGSGNQTTSFSTEALKGNWHNITYTQKGTIGSIYIDGILLASTTITNKPTTALIKNGLMGTPYNWIGRSCFTTDAFLRKTMIYDFRLYSKALTKDEILHTELNVSNNIENLEAAHAAYVASTKTAETQIIEASMHPKATALNLVNTNNQTTSVELVELKKITFDEAQMYLLLGNGNTNNYAINQINNMLFANSATSIQSAIQETSLQIIPNPATDFVQISNINTPNSMVYIYTITGQIIHHQTINSDAREINISKLPAGIYLVVMGKQFAKFTKR